MSENTTIYDAVCRPPKAALKTIKGGRLRGMTDINPQWRYRILTEQFSPCGVGWRYTIDRVWTEATGGNTICVFAMVSLYIKDGEKWGGPIPGIGGNQLVEKEKTGWHVNDECFKMAVTDALRVACKALGVGADIYMGRWDGSKYVVDQGEPPNSQRQQPQSGGH